MKPFVVDKRDSSGTPLYIQLYRRVREEILSGGLSAGEKLPSLRSLAAETGVSVTTAEQAYGQLLTEGYIVSRPQSGFYVAEIPAAIGTGALKGAAAFDFDSYTFETTPYLYDLSAFDFQKWKKCTSRVFSEYANLLLFESDVQGEAPLRFEISKYVYQSRGVSASPEQIVIGAGTQQLTAHLCRILRRMGIDHVCTEDPGYLPIQQIFQDNGFGIGRIPVTREGIRIDKLPVNISSAVYVSPANQFPTGSVMPVANRYRLLEWARENDSIILEDDYDSELRYFGKPIPALQGLDQDGRVVYLGSFSSTLFPAIRISYMVLPPAMAEIFAAIKSDYTQTCSKTEQLTLALFMEDGYYYTNIRRLRSLYAQKLHVTTAALSRYGAGLIEPMDTKSGLNIILRVSSQRTAEELSEAAARLGIHATPMREASSVRDTKKRHLIFYYSQIPLDQLETSIEAMAAAWRAL